MTDIDKDGELKMIRVFAELRYEKYTALVDAGFSEKQALEIIINTGVMG